MINRLLKTINFRITSMKNTTACIYFLRVEISDFLLFGIYVFLFYLLRIPLTIDV